MMKYVLLMKDQPESPVQWHCAFDAEDYDAAVKIATSLVKDGFSFDQPVVLMLNGVRIIEISLQAAPRVTVLKPVMP